MVGQQQDITQFVELDSASSQYQDTVRAIGETPISSLFQGHELTVENGLTFISKTDVNNGFAFAILCLCAGIIIYLQRNSDDIFTSVLKASFDQNLSAQDARVENSQRSQNLFILQLLGFVSISLFISGGIQSQLGRYENLQSIFFVFLVALAAFVIAKKLLLWVLAQLFDLRAELKIHVFNLNILQAVAGLFLLPLALLMFYGPTIPGHLVFYAGLSVGFFFYLKGLQRGLTLAINTSSVRLLYLFYYFCALEILPVFVMIRIAQDLQ